VDVVGSGDYDGDGHADILWFNRTPSQVRVWLMDGLTVLSDNKIAVLPAPVADWIVVRVR
jgi:hypothetical protein